MATCTVQDCGKRSVVTRELGGARLPICDTHRKRLERTGNLELARVRGLPGIQLPWRMAPYLADLIRHAAEVDGVDPAKWTEEALMAALLQERYAE